MKRPSRLLRSLPPEGERQWLRAAGATEMKLERFANTPVRAEPVEAPSRTSPTLRHGDFDKLSPLLRANGRMFMRRGWRAAQRSN